MTPMPEIPYNTPHFKVGDIVYRPYTPQRPGKVIAVREEEGSREMTEVCGVEGEVLWADYEYDIKWINGTVTTEIELHLSDFNQLIADHRKKLATHETMLKRVQAL